MARRSNGRCPASRAGPAAPSFPAAAGRADRVRLWLRGQDGMAGPDGADRVRLICFPYAGGGASVFASWTPGAAGAPAAGHMEICPLQYPGRETRWGEPGFATVAELVEAIRRDLAPVWDEPFALAGHSFGALVAFELARALDRAGGPLPRRLFVSGARAPGLPQRAPIHQLDDEAFLAKLRRFDGVPEEALRHPDLMSVALVALRHDFKLMETHAIDRAPALPVPISAFGGLQDTAVPVADVLAWAGETTKAFRTRFFQGGHFFAFGSGSRIAELMGEDLAASAAPQPARPWVAA